MTRTFRFGLLTGAAFGLAACASFHNNNAPPDYRIMVATDPAGAAPAMALPPECANWSLDVKSPFNNQPDPTFGCASARNLALQVDDAADLVDGRTIGPADAEKGTSAVRRYRSGGVLGLHDPTQPPPAISPTPDKTATSTAQ